jgi:hypothetical protein
VVELVGVRASEADVARHRVLIDLDQAAGGAGAATLADVFEEGDGLILGQASAFERGPFAFGKGLLAGAAVNHTDAPIPTRPSAEIKVALGPLAVVGTRYILAAEVFDGVHRGILPVANSLPDTGFCLNSFLLGSTNGCTPWPDTTDFRSAPNFRAGHHFS